MTCDILLDNSFDEVLQLKRVGPSCERNIRHGVESRVIEMDSGM